MEKIEMNLRVTDPGDKKYSRYLAPLFGLVFGTALGIQGFASVDTDQEKLLCVTVGSSLGLVVGVILMLIDRGPTNRRTDEPVVVSRFAALIGMAFTWFPVVGLIVGVFVFLITRKSSDWSRIIGRLSLIFGLAVQVVFAVVPGAMANWLTTFARMIEWLPG